MDDFLTGVHALRWVLAFVILAPLAVTIAVMGWSAFTRPTRTTTRPIAPRDPYADHPAWCRCVHHR